MYGEPALVTERNRTDIVFTRQRDTSFFTKKEARIGTVVAKEESRTRRVDKGKSGQAQKTAVSGGFGGGILSQLIKSRHQLFLGERS